MRNVKCVDVKCGDVGWLVDSIPMVGALQGVTAQARSKKNEKLFPVV